MSSLFGTLTIIRPDGSEELRPLSKATVSIGRETDNDIVLDDRRISRHHAQILCKPDSLSVVDLGSANGILVNGLRPPPHEPVLLEAEAEIELGGVRLIVQSALAAPRSMTSPPREQTQDLDHSVVPPTTIATAPANATGTQQANQTAEETPDQPAAPEPPRTEHAPQSAEDTPDETVAPLPSVAEGAPPVVAEAAEPPAPPNGNNKAQGGHERIEVVMDPADPVVPCKDPFLQQPPTTVSVKVDNRSQIVDAFELSVTGIPPDWYNIHPQEIYLDTPSAPNKQHKGAFEIEIAPPREASSTARKYAFFLAIRAKSSQIELFNKKYSLEVQPFYELTSHLDPRKKIKGRYRGEYYVIITNKSNAPLFIRIEAEDDENALQIEFDTDSFELGPGKERKVRARVHAKRRWPLGKPISYGLTTIVIPKIVPTKTDAPALAPQRHAPALAPQRHEATLVLHRLPAWLLLLLLPLLLPLLLLLPTTPRQTTRVESQMVGLPPIELPAHPVAKETITLAFAREGTIEQIMVPAGAKVRAGTVVAQLRYYEQLLAIRRAEDELEQTIEALRLARAQQARTVEQAQLDLEQAQETAARLGPDGPDNPARQVEQQLLDAQRELAQAQRAQASTQAAGDEAVFAIDDDLKKAVESLQEAQQRFSKAYWEYEWVQEHGTDPNVANAKQVESGANGKSTTEQVPVQLNEVQKLAFHDALETARRELQEAERTVEAAKRAFNLTQAAQEEKNIQASEAVQALAEQVQTLNAQLAAGDNPALSTAQRAIKQAQLKVEVASTSGLEPYLKAVDDAQQALDDARVQLENRKLVAPRPGIVMAVLATTGTSVQTSTPIIVLAVPGELELALSPAPEQVPLLREGMPVTVTLAGQQPVSSTIRRLPLPIAASANGQQPDQTVRIAASSLPLTLDSSALVSIERERRRKALVVPPPFVYKEGDNRYLLVKISNSRLCVLYQPWCQQRIDVRVGLETPEWVEILGAYGQVQQQANATAPPVATLSPQAAAAALEGVEILGP